jgi:restriction-modification enzyme MmeI-like protein
MDHGEFAASIRTKVLKFNGNLFAEARVLPLGREEIGELLEAARKDWHEVEPAIFGTLLEQALDESERRRLGAHYTPRAYVERLVVTTIIEPLREDWRNVQAAAEAKRGEGDKNGAADAVKSFHDKICETRVLDPACGTGNFLYVAMELMKRLEGEVLEALVDLGGQEALRGLGQHTIDPHQFLGLEINPRAAAIAELVLWIGFLQWHFRTQGGIPSEPILRKFKNIEVKNAVLSWDGYPVPQVVAGEEAYPNPRRPMWPTAEFIVGNPPFIGGKDIRSRLGDAYATALWTVHEHMNESADFVMYWWDRSAELLTAKGTMLRRFGLVTTNSITQEFSRRVMKKRIDSKHPISLVMAIPDHPWTRTPEAAAVRIAMTVAQSGEHLGVLREVIREDGLNTDQPNIEFATYNGRINSNLTIGTDVTSAVELRANKGLCCPGVKLHGDGFIVTQQEAEHLGLGKRPGLQKYIREYRNGRDLTSRSRGAMVIDLFGLSADEVRGRYPEVYQHIKSEVKEKIIINRKGEKELVGRDWNNRMAYREMWWVFGEPRRELRPALVDLNRYIVTVETMQHRVFQFLDASILPDNRLVVVATSDAFILGVLSSYLHLVWTSSNGGTLEDRPIYTKSRCFDPFPFPSPGSLLMAQIGGVADELDAFRRQRQAEHPSLTLTQMYNVLEKLRANVALEEDEERVNKDGLVVILNELHDKLDRLVCEAYGWQHPLTDKEILSNLVALNHERAAEERRGHVRWLRPEYQINRFGREVDKQAADEEDTQIVVDFGLPGATAQKSSFPADTVEQTAAVFTALASSGGPTDALTIASRFRKTKNVERTISGVLASLARLGYVATKDGRTFEIRRAG